jgi:hypothetical protein
MKFRNKQHSMERLRMSKTLKLVMAGLVAGTFLLGAPPAHAIFGIRAARTAIAARKARKELSSSDAETKAATPEARTTTPGEKNPSLEEMKRLEQESKKS